MVYKYSPFLQRGLLNTKEKSEAEKIELLKQLKAGSEDIALHLHFETMSILLTCAGGNAKVPRPSFCGDLC